PPRWRPARAACRRGPPARRRCRAVECARTPGRALRRSRQCSPSHPLRLGRRRPRPPHRRPSVPGLSGASDILARARGGGQSVLWTTLWTACADTRDGLCTTCGQLCGFVVDGLLISYLTCDDVIHRVCGKESSPPGPV